MNINKCRTFQGNMSHEPDSLAKISATQTVIKNKFVKAYTNRIEHENDVNETMKPLTCSRQRRSTSKKTNKNSLLNINDINELCNRLQKLINSQISRNVNYSQEIKMIISKLRELGIIV